MEITWPNRRLIKYHGISKNKFLLYIKEMDGWYNNRNIDLSYLLIKYILWQIIALFYLKRLENKYMGIMKLIINAVIIKSSGRNLFQMCFIDCLVRVFLHSIYASFINISANIKSSANTSAQFRYFLGKINK